MTLIEALGTLGQKQRVGLELEDGTTVEARINQSIYAPEDTLRLELTPDSSNGFQRYQARARVEDGKWTPVLLRGVDPEDGVWTDLGTVADFTPLETYGTLKSKDMEAQENTGTEE